MNRLLPRRLLLRRLSTAAEPTSPSPSSSPLSSRPHDDDSLYFRVLASGNPRVPLVPVLEQWALAEARPVDKRELHAIIKKLIRLHRFSHALEISMWMTDRRHFGVSPGDVAYRLELIAKVHGVESAAAYFGTVPAQLRRLQSYGSMLKCYTEAKNVEKAEAMFGAMREMGMLSSYAYNVMMKLYLEIGQVERVHEMYRAMQDSGIKPDTFTMDVVVAVHAAADDVRKIGKLLEKANPRERLLSWHAYATVAKVFKKAGLEERAFEALHMAEKRIDPKNGRVAYGCLLSVYADMGLRCEVDRIWDVYKSNMPACNSMYMCRISVLLKMNDFDGAEKAFEEWESRHVRYDFRLTNILVDAYCTEGLMEKAEDFVSEAIKKGKKPYANTWYKLAGGYFKKGQVSKAVDLTRKALATASSGWKPDLTNVLMSLNHFKEQKNVEAAEEMASLLQGLVPLTRDVFHGLLKTYVDAGKPVSDLLDRMKEHGLEADEETDRIIAGKLQ